MPKLVRSRTIVVNIVVNETIEGEYGANDVASSRLQADMPADTLALAAAVKTTLDQMVQSVGRIRPAIVAEDEEQDAAKDIADALSEPFADALSEPF